MVALAAPYGEGTYGGGIYNVGDQPANDKDSPSTSTPTPKSSTSTSKCSDQAPGNKAPWLYAAVAKSRTSIEIFFTDAQEPYDHYVLEYGTEVGNYQWSATSIGGKGTRTYVVSSLRPSTTYFFRVRAGNGCATGEWSNELSATTKDWLSAFSTQPLDTTSIDAEIKTAQKDTLETVQETEESEQQQAEDKPETDTDETSSQVPGVNVKIKVVDENKRPVGGAKVTLYSTPKETTTDKDGVAYFEGVEPGEHRAVIAYKDQTGEQKINVPENGEVDEIDFTIQIMPVSPFSNIWVKTVIGLLSLSLIMILALLLKKRSRA